MYRSITKNLIYSYYEFILTHNYFIKYQYIMNKSININKNDHYNEVVFFHFQLIFVLFSNKAD